MLIYTLLLTIALAIAKGNSFYFFYKRTAHRFSQTKEKRALLRNCQGLIFSLSRSHYEKD